MTDNRTTELLPCPFCGGEAHTTETARYGTRYGVACFCGASVRFFDTEAEAIEAWNTRTPVEYDGWFYLPKPKENIVQYGESEIVKTECGYKINHRVGVFESAIREWGDQLGEYVMKRVGEVFNPTETCENMREKFGYKRLFVCSECGVTFDPDCEINYCPCCGRKVVDNAD